MRTDVMTHHVYKGNWLRDYSQAIDVAGLSKMHFDSLLTIVQFLGFMVSPIRGQETNPDHAI